MEPQAVVVEELLQVAHHIPLPTLLEVLLCCLGDVGHLSHTEILATSFTPKIRVRAQRIQGQNDPRAIVQSAQQ